MIDDNLSFTWLIIMLIIGYSLGAITLSNNDEKQEINIVFEINSKYLDPSYEPEPESYWEGIWENTQLITIPSNSSTTETDLPDFSKCKQIICGCAKNTKTPCIAIRLECL